jgi:hypothetical protein
VLVRLVRVFLVVALLAGWQASLQHSVEHAAHAHEDVALCDALDALAACAPDATQPIIASQLPEYSPQSPHKRAPRRAEALPFFSQGPPAFA